jgi:threonine dehydrogenase-like Zn-dependent dehydrogenase
LTDTQATRPGTIRAVVFQGPGRILLCERPRPALASAADVLIAVEACGICGTDLHILEDPPGHPAAPGVVLGHELVGHVAEAGPEARGVTVGDRVVVAPNISCGSCAPCKQGAPSACQNFSTVGIFRDGGLADLVSVPARACHRVTGALPARVAALAEPLSCVLNGIRRVRPMPGEVAVIHGAGAIGLLFLAVLGAGGVRCVVAEPVTQRREAARLMGAAATVDPAAADVRAAVTALQPGGADLAVDAVGSQFGAAVAEVRPGGEVLLFGMNSRARSAIAQNDITRREITVHGAYVGEATFPAAVRLLESGLLRLDPVISHYLPLDRAQDAVDALRSGGAVKAVLDVAGSAAIAGDPGGRSLGRRGASGFEQTGASR